MVSTTTGLHRDNTGWQLLDEFDQCLSPYRSTDNHSAALIYPNNAATVLPDVDTQYGNLHDTAPFPSTEGHHTRCPRKGGPSHNQQNGVMQSAVALAPYAEGGCRSRLFKLVAKGGVIARKQ
jgi:hypothetical protein